MTPEPDRSHPAVGPVVAAIAAAVHAEADGTSYIDRYAEWVIELTHLDPQQYEATFVELAALSRRHRSLGDEAIARRLAELARIGLEPIVRREDRQIIRSGYQDQTDR